jgi:transcriptional regulator with XRE-family HTH domain
MAIELRAALSRRRLTSALRNLRAETGETQRQVAEALDWSQAKVLRIEVGRVGISTQDLKGMLAHYKVDEVRQRELIELARMARKKTISQDYRDLFPAKFNDFLEHEEAASIIRQFETKLIPGPLQTPEYARVVLQAYAAPEESEEMIEKRVQARMSRKQMLLQEDAPQATYIMDEVAARRHVGAESGNMDLMIRQLQHLKELAAYENIGIRVVPLSAGMYRAIRGPFVILEFEDPADPNLLYREDPEGEVLIHDSSAITASYLEMFIEVEKIATRAENLNDTVDRIVDDLRQAS